MNTRISEQERLTDSDVTSIPTKVRERILKLEKEKINKGKLRKYSTKSMNI